MGRAWNKCLPIYPSICILLSESSLPEALMIEDHHRERRTYMHVLNPVWVTQIWRINVPKKGYLLTQISKFRMGMSEVTQGITRSLSAVSMLLCSLSGCHPHSCFWMMALFPPIADGLLPHEGDRGWILLLSPRQGSELFFSRSVGKLPGKNSDGSSWSHVPTSWVWPGW